MDWQVLRSDKFKDYAVEPGQLIQTVFSDRLSVTFFALWGFNPSGRSAIVSLKHLVLGNSINFYYLESLISHHLKDLYYPPVLRVYMYANRKSLYYITLLIAFVYSL
ncbi:MAG TPA: hypothetical protein V6C85_12325 [Allocoleopsis sp.]